MLKQTKESEIWRMTKAPLRAAVADKERKRKKNERTRMNRNPFTLNNHKMFVTFASVCMSTFEIRLERHDSTAFHGNAIPSETNGITKISRKTTAFN